MRSIRESGKFVGFRKPYLAIIVLVLSHGLILLAEFFAPYKSTEQNRELPFVPPTRIHFTDEQGKVHLWPFVYRTISTENSGSYREDRSVRYPVELFALGPAYVVAGRFTWHRHFFEAAAPAKLFLLGSDAYGRDQFSRFLYGGRISLFGGILATAVSLSLGLILGGMAGYYGGWLDQIVTRAVEIFLALPWLYFLLTVRALIPLQMPPDRTFLLLIAVVGAIGWARPARLIRGIVLSAKQRDYVLAAKGFGASDLYLLRRHVLPGAWAATLTHAAVLIPTYVLTEVILSLFGLGVSEPFPSWGNLLASLSRFEVLESFWWIFAPVVILAAIFASYFAVFSYYRYYTHGEWR